MRVLLCFLIVSMSIGCYEASAQRDTLTVRGTVLDSLTHLPLPMVTVVNQSAHTVSTTDDFGKFQIMCSAGDSLHFTLLGYASKKKIIWSGNTSMTLFLREAPYTLNTVTVYGKFKPQGLDQWNKAATVKQSIFKNPAGPGSGAMVETFGPGIVIGGLLSKLTKSEKEKKKLKKERENNISTATYREVITAQETKDYFMTTFSITEDEYNKFIERFNMAHPEAAQIPNKEDIMSLLVIFYAERKTDR
jgi:hypothetical protein